MDRLVPALSGGSGAGPLADLDVDVLRGGFEAKRFPHLVSAQAALPHLTEHAVLPVRRVASADDVAEAVVLAATNPNITATVVETDGGARLVSLV